MVTGMEIDMLNMIKSIAKSLIEIETRLGEIALIIEDHK